MMAIGSNGAEFGYPSKSLAAYYHQRDLTLGLVFLINIRFSTMSIFVNVDLELHFQGHLLQELDGQTHCDHLVKT